MDPAPREKVAPRAEVLACLLPVFPLPLPTANPAVMVPLGSPLLMLPVKLSGKLVSFPSFTTIGVSNMDVPALFACV